jgi:signal transduction histidine kinase
VPPTEAAPPPCAALTVERLDGWERRLESAVAVVPYIGLVVSTVLAVAVYPEAQLHPLWVTLAASAAAALWMLWWVTLHPAWAERRWLMAVYYVGLIVLIAGLCVRSPVYGFFAFSGYLHAVYALRGRWRMVGVVLTALLTATTQVGGFPTLTSAAGVTAYVVVALFNIAVAGAMSVLGWISTAQMERRKEMIAELADTNDKLTAAMAENAGLHRQLLSQAREAGVLDERARMAREIHDTIAQGLIGIITQLSAATPAHHVDTALGLARESLAEARRSVRALRPSPLEDATLPDALAAVARQWSAVHGTAAEVVTTGTVQAMHPEIEGTLLRTAQEALANVAKHADASRVGLTLSYMDDVVTLDVRDDGIGFDPAADRPDGEHGGFGLTAMRQRLHRIAGLLEIESEPGGGTAISARVPAIPATGGAA